MCGSRRGCVRVYMNCNDIKYIYHPSNASVIARAPPERVAKILLLLLCVARSRFSPVDVSSIVVPVRIIVIILYILYLYACINRFRRRRQLCSRSIRFIVYLWLHVFSATRPQPFELKPSRSPGSRWKSV